jgi:hypothetical protein
MKQEVKYEVIPYEVTERDRGKFSVTKCPYIAGKFVGSYYCACLCRYSLSTPKYREIKCSYKYQNI